MPKFWGVGGWDSSDGPITFVETPGKNYEVNDSATPSDYFNFSYMNMTLRKSQLKQTDMPLTY